MGEAKKDVRAGADHGGGYEGIPQDENADGLVYINAHTAEPERAAFRNKVFQIVFVQLLYTAGITALFKWLCPLEKLIDVQQQKLNEDELKKHGGVIGGLFVYQLIGLLCFVLYLCVACCCTHLLRKKPYNYILTALITVGYSASVVVACFFTPPMIILQAGVTTLFLVLGLAVYAVNTSTDWSGFGHYLYGILIAVIVFSCTQGLLFYFNLISRETFLGLETAISFLVIILFSCFLIYDMQMIMGGAHRQYQYNTEDYCLAATNLYADIVLIFIEIIMLLNRR